MCNEKRKSNPINKLKHSKRFVCEKKKKKTAKKINADANVGCFGP